MTRAKPRYSTKLQRLVKRVHKADRKIEEKRISTLKGELVPYERLLELWQAVRELVDEVES